MADCRLHLEAARYEAKRVVTRLLRDHDAWGQVSREGRPREKVPETREEFRNRRGNDEPSEKALPVRFESLRLEKNSASAGEPQDDGPRPSRGVQEGRHTTSTPAGSDREQRRKGSPEEISGIRGVHLPPPAPRREISPGRPSSRRMYPSPTESSEDEYDSYPRRNRGRKTEGRSALPGREGLTSGAAEKNGRGAERRARETGSRLALAEQLPRGQADLGHHRERRHTLTRRGT